MILGIMLIAWVLGLLSWKVDKAPSALVGCLLAGLVVCAAWFGILSLWHESTGDKNTNVEMTLEKFGDEGYVNAGREDGWDYYQYFERSATGIDKQTWYDQNDVNFEITTGPPKAVYHCVSSDWKKWEMYPIPKTGIVHPDCDAGTLTLYLPKAEIPYNTEGH